MLSQNVAPTSKSSKGKRNLIHQDNQPEQYYNDITENLVGIRSGLLSKGNFLVWDKLL